MNQEEIEKYLKICKECEYSTYELIKKSDPVPSTIRIAGNVFRRALNSLGIRVISCRKCGCCVGIKARIMRHQGCPEGKWDMAYIKKDPQLMRIPQVSSGCCGKKKK